jgi:hypothetical protein
MRRTWLGSCVSKNHGEIEECSGHLFHLRGNMTAKSALFVIFLELLVSMICGSSAQAQASATQTQAVPEVDVHLELPSGLRVLAFSGLEQGQDYSYQQWYAAGALGYQLKPILRQHLINIDPDKEHYFLFGGGYEFLQTTEPGKVKDEERITLDATPGFLLPAGFLVRDRNWVELRWIDGKYSTTYRNMLTVERDILLHGFRFNPYGSAEAFYDSPKHSWDQEWYTGGVGWPYKHLFMVDTFYRRENCPTCKPAHWNVGGVTLNFFFAHTK